MSSRRSYGIQAGPEELLRQAKARPLAVRRLALDPSRWGELLRHDPIGCLEDLNGRIRRCNANPALFDKTHGWWIHNAGLTLTQPEAARFLVHQSIRVGVVATTLAAALDETRRLSETVSATAELHRFADECTRESDVDRLSATRTYYPKSIADRCQQFDREYVDQGLIDEVNAYLYACVAGLTVDLELIAGRRPKVWTEGLESEHGQGLVRTARRDGYGGAVMREALQFTMGLCDELAMRPGGLGSVSDGLEGFASTVRNGLTNNLNPSVAAHSSF